MTHTAEYRQQRTLKKQLKRARKAREKQLRARAHSIRIARIKESRRK